MQYILGAPFPVAKAGELRYARAAWWGVFRNSAALIVFCFFSKVSPSKETQKRQTLSLKRTAKAPCKMDGWKTIVFLLGQKAYFQVRDMLGPRECTYPEMWGGFIKVPPFFYKR